MPFSTAASRIQYTTNGVTVAFPITFPFFDETTMNAAWADSLGNVTDLALTTDFTITGGDGENGTLTTTGALSPLANGGTVTIYRNEPNIQTTEFTDNSPLPAEDLNDVADKAAMRDGQLADLGARSLSFPPTIAPTVSAELPTPVPDYFLRFSSDGLSLEAAAISPSGSVSQATETSAGIAEIATQAETNTGTDDLRMVTPKKLASSTLAATVAANTAALAALHLPTGYQQDARIANNGTDAVNDINFTQGSCRSDADAADLLLGGTNVKQIDVAFAEYVAIGTASGGRDSGDNLTGAKTFHAYLIGGTGKNTQGFFSTSLSPTLPSGFTWKRRRGSIRWSGSTIVPFTQDLSDTDLFLLTTTEQAYAGANPGTSAVTVPCTIPTGLKLTPLGSVGLLNGTSTSIAGRMYGADEATTAPLGSTSTSPAAPGGNFSSQAGSPANWIWTPLPRSLRSDTSGQVFFKLDVSGASDRVAVEITGWLDRRL